MDDVAALSELNRQFVDAFRQGSWKILQPVLSPSFRYLDGATGELWALPRYIDDLRSHPVPTIEIDQVVVHVEGDVAIASARSSTRPGQFNRYVDAYRRRNGSWLCYSACVWPLPSAPVTEVPSGP